MIGKNVWFVIVTYTPDKEVLRQLIAAIKGYRRVVVDNTKKNLGYAGGANRGMKKAFDAGAQWVVVLNEDIRISPLGLASFIKTLLQRAPGIYGPKAGYLDPLRFTAYETDGKSTDKAAYIAGFTIAVHAEVFRTIGLFYEPYFLYYEEVDFCIRAAKHGFPVVDVPSPGITHLHTAVLARYSELYEYYLARNHLLFVWRLAPVSVKFREFLRMPKTVWEHVKRGNVGAIRGIRDFARGRFGAYGYRR